MKWIWPKSVWISSNGEQFRNRIALVEVLAPRSTRQLRQHWERNNIRNLVLGTEGCNPPLKKTKHEQCHQREYSTKQSKVTLSFSPSEKLFRMKKQWKQNSKRVLYTHVRTKVHQVTTAAWPTIPVAYSNWNSIAGEYDTVNHTAEPSQQRITSHCIRYKPFPFHTIYFIRCALPYSTSGKLLVLLYSGLVNYSWHACMGTTHNLNYVNTLRINFLREHGGVALRRVDYVKFLMCQRHQPKPHRRTSNAEWTWGV